MAIAAKGCRLRKARFSESGRIYLLTVVVHQREPVFADWRMGRLLVDQLRCADQTSVVHSMAWVVMPDHLHWLLELQHGTLAELMCRIKSRSSRSINLVRRSQGRLWQRGYYDRALRRDEDIKGAARYIVMNPLRAGLVKRVGDYPLWDAIWI
ncbi:REP element-mobilizing transposase RayT [Pseudomonas frederiksbergensis]|jgi:REP element-mobilizing transposase RayT|uniref:REP-associated tyrosine transposase n=1 Tax=Pseudomonas frederiksbergensis TaxID=104087 RepID=UPI003D24B528